MFFTEEVLPQWTEFGLVLGYPAVLGLLAQFSSSEEDDKILLQYYIC